VANGRFTATVVGEDGRLRHTSQVTIRVDGISPTTPTSVTPGAGFWFSPDGQVTLRWSGSTDAGSGPSSNASVRRRVARPLMAAVETFANEASGEVLPTGFSEDAAERLLLPLAGAALDQAGNPSDAVTSGRVLVDTVGQR
jgi:hypothetical protein